ncbi:MAG: transglutaminase-like domain-containing protein [Desulfobacterales bacterium]|jgi:transglutaminase-like putative cysteine protease|nr:transglutaminase domain-containing protein [Deltaproteobacteria bacterium]
MAAVHEKYLAPTSIIDADSKIIMDYAMSAIEGAEHHPISKAISLYYAVRDAIWYDPYIPFYRPEHYRSSHVLKNGRAFCIGKAGLLCALARACGIPARVGFADVRNHLATRQLLDYLGSDIFAYHGFTEFYLDGRWVKATPAFNKELCHKAKVTPLEFNGKEDSIFQPYNEEKKLFMEYVNDHGTFADIPVDRIVKSWKAVYGSERVRQWIDAFEKSGGKRNRKLENEDWVR